MGRSVKDYIYGYFIERVKIKLFNFNDLVSQVVYSFGFDYLQNFSKFFKFKMGMSFSEY